MPLLTVRLTDEEYAAVIRFWLTDDASRAAAITRGTGPLFDAVREEARLVGAADRPFATPRPAPKPASRKR